MIWISISSETE